MDVSIIIPVHNDEKYIEETLTSIAQQTLRGFEVIVVDDGSTDSTPLVVERFAEQDARFSLIRQEHANAGVARNTGYEASQGEYVLFFDGDDIMRSDMLEVMVENAKEYDAEITVCQASSFSTDNIELDKTEWAAIGRDAWGPFGAEFNEVYRGVDLPQTPFFTTIGWAWDKLFKRSLIDEYDLRFQSISSTNDALFVFCAISLANRIVFIDEDLVLYRMHPKSISATRSKNPHNSRKAYEAISEHLSQYPDIWKRCEKACENWGISHTRWNYRTLEGEAREEAFEDYKELLLGALKDCDVSFHDIEEDWVREAFRFNPGNESMYVADLAIDFGYVKRERDNLIKTKYELDEANRKFNELQKIANSPLKWLKYQFRRIDAFIQRRMKK